MDTTVSLGTAATSGRSDLPIVLINPGWPVKSGVGGIIPDLYPALGIASIGAVLRAKGYEVSIIDIPIEQLDDEGVMARIDELEPAVVGITVVTMTYYVGVRLARLLRERRRDVTIVVGGVHVTDSADECLAEESFDYSICGAGEEPMLALCEGLRRGRVPGDLAGVGFNQADTPYRNPTAEATWDGLPPTAYDLYDMERYRTLYGHMSLMTAHGCNARCVFCTSGYRYASVKFVPIERVKAELTALVRDFGFRYINIFDSNFTYRNDWVHAICDFIIEESLDIRWRCFSKTNGVDRELFDHMAAAGCSHLLFGVESSHDETMRLIKKGTTRRQIENAFALSREAGISRVAYSIVGLPGETEEDVLGTIDFMEHVDAEFNVISPISLMPGTPLMDRMEDFGMVLLESDWSKHDGGGRLGDSAADVAATNGLIPPDRIQHLVQVAYDRLNGGATSYDWHEQVTEDPGRCPHAAMLGMLEGAGDAAP